MKEGVEQQQRGRSDCCYAMTVSFNDNFPADIVHKLQLLQTDGVSTATAHYCTSKYKEHLMRNIFALTQSPINNTCIHEIIYGYWEKLNHALCLITHLKSKNKGLCIPMWNDVASYSDVVLSWSWQTDTSATSVEYRQKAILINMRQADVQAVSHELDQVKSATHKAIYGQSINSASRYVT